MNYKITILPLLLALAWVAPSVYAMPNKKITGWYAPETISLPDYFSYLAATGQADSLESYFERYEIRKYKFDIDQEVEWIDRKGAITKYPLMHFAAIKGHINVMKVLLKYGASVNLKSKAWSKTPLQLACHFGQVDVVKFLLEQDNLELDATDRVGMTALHEACHGSDYEIVDFLGVKAQHLVCTKNRIEIVKLLLEQGANSNAKSRYGWTPLGLAEGKCYKEIATLLLA